LIAAASWPREDASETRVLRVRPSGALELSTSGALSRWIAAGSVVVVNDAATVPASLMGQTSAGDALEARLAEVPEREDSVVRAVLFAPGDWRAPTEARTDAPTVHGGDVLSLGPLRARVERVDAAHPRLVWLRFLSANLQALFRELYAHGRPVQYSYLRGALALWHVQTPLATRPVAVEAPSSGYALDWALLAKLRANGVQIAPVTHATGLSSTGDAAMDRLFPLDEPYEISARSAQMISRAIDEGRAVVAIGTGAMRAIESSARANGGRVQAERARTALRLGPSERALVTSALLTGVHEPESSHGALLAALIERATVERAAERARDMAMLGHEFGDAMFVERDGVVLSTHASR
jgi:S-adenosylmethionine:tRNA ribosyltransferase-isomerase